jgi:hypothetical protein
VLSFTSACILVTYSPTASVLYSVVGCLAEALIILLLYRLSPAIAMLDGNRSFSSQINLDQGIQRMLSSSPARELTEILPSTRNATAQPGKSRPRHREAFLLLARLYHMKGMPRASLQRRSHQRSIAAKIVIVRRRENRGGELSLYS